MRDLDLSILEKDPVLDRSAMLKILPLAPLSMVKDLPGSYYKAAKVPDESILSGLFENILGWHLDISDRKEIAKLREKKLGSEALNKKNTRSSFLPLLVDYFKIEIAFSPEMIHYDDYWSRAYRRADAYVHPLGTFNINHELIPKKIGLKRDEKGKIDTTELTAFFKKNIGGYPLYYSTPTKREFISTKGIYNLKLSFDYTLLTQLINAVKQNNICYLGNSEGWVDVGFEEK